MPTLERLAVGLLEQTSAFAAHVRDLTATVPTCPEWTVRDLVAHIGQEHRWAEEIVRSGAPVDVPDPRAQEVPDDWAAWLRDGAVDLVEAVGDGVTPVWTYFGDGPSRFWLRRMLHDTTVHHADLAGRDALIPADLAGDALEGLLELLTAPGAPALKPALAELRGDGHTIALRPHDATPWSITRGSAGPTWRRGGGDGDVTVTASARDLLLVATRRLSPDATGVTVSGDRSLLDHWLTHTAL
ncbi:maleylpyruvate isomerase family mycothiol-dependent enzyme [Actinosynnema sp. NPDC091369]